MPILHLNWLLVFKVNHHRVEHHLTGLQAEFSAQHITDFYTLEAVKFAAMLMPTTSDLVSNVLDFNQR